jgi:hypothetical protein
VCCLNSVVTKNQILKLREKLETLPLTGKKFDFLFNRDYKQQRERVRDRETESDSRRRSSGAAPHRETDRQTKTETET